MLPLTPQANRTIIVEVSLMNVQAFKQELGIEILIRQPVSGCTERSKRFFDKMKVHLSSYSRVALVYIGEPDWEFLTFVIDVNGDAILLDGFSWGYHGEGPRGLQWLFGQMGWDIDESLLPPAHTEGMWLIFRDHVEGP